MPLVYANTNDFKEKLTDGRVVVDFYADWCAPCRMIGPVLEQIARENDDILIVKVNVDENQALAVEYGIRGIPALLVFNGGKQVASRAGFMPKDALVDWIKSA